MTVWQLRGSRDKVIECHVEPAVWTAHALTVLLGKETFLYEAYPDEASALGRAMQVRERLLQGGGWTAVTDQDAG